MLITSIPAYKIQGWNYSQMRLLKKRFSVYERRFVRQLKDLRIKFITKPIIKGMEIDFLIGKNVIEIDGHIQRTDKNKILMESGYNVYHFPNNEVGEITRDWLIQNKNNLKWQKQV